MQKDFAAIYGDLEKWHWWFRGRRRILEAVLRKELPHQISRRILSVGCGPSGGLTWLIPFAGAGGKIVGVDVDADHTESAPENIEVINSSLEDVSLPEHSFDLVLALDVLEHLDDDVAGLRKIATLLKPDAMLLVTVPALPSLWGAQDIVSHHRRRYTKRSLEAVFAANNLNRSRITYFNSILFPLAASVRWSRRFLGLADRNRSDFEDNKPGLVNDALAWMFGLESYALSFVSPPVGLSLLSIYKAK